MLNFIILFFIIPSFSHSRASFVFFGQQVRDKKVTDNENLSGYF